MSCASATCSPTTSFTLPAPAFARPESFAIPWRLLLRATTGTLARFGAPRTQRRVLSELDDRLLADIGISRNNAMAEARKTFWR